MKPCSCGGKLYRHKKSEYKLSRLFKITLRCKQCGKRESFIEDSEVKPVFQYQAMGRPFYVENEMGAC